MIIDTNPVSPWVINVGMIFLASALTFLSAFYWNQRKLNIDKAIRLAEENEKVKARLVEVESKLAIVSASIVPISVAFQAILIKELTHYHTPELDALLVKIGPPNTLTSDDEAQLKLLLKERSEQMNGTISVRERDAASILPAVMARAKEELKLLEDENTKVKFVTVATMHGIPGIDMSQDTK